jgi:hypothetical protein
VNKKVPEDIDQDVRLSKDEVLAAFNAHDRTRWSTLLSNTESGADLKSSLDSNSYVTLKQFSTWWIVEDSTEKIGAFMTQGMY